MALPFSLRRANPAPAPAPAVTPVPAVPLLEGAEPLPGTPEALLLLAGLGVAAPVPGAEGARSPQDPRFAPPALGAAVERLITVKRKQEQLSQEQKQLQELLRLAHLRGDLRRQLPPAVDGAGYLVGQGLALVRRQGRKQWRYTPTCQELECQLKARQGYEQSTGEASYSLGPAFWELRSIKG